ncbi:MAG: phosphatase [Deltaproteobacteria bacterium]|nr:phosphatase [Deltaproteobacteria bacterium]
MRVQADLHVHTVASGHAFSTVSEIAREAARRGLRAVGIADHGPALPGAPHPFYFGALRFLPRTMEGVRILRGVEANIVHARGRLDLPRELLSRLDYILVGYHEGCGLKVRSPAKNTATMIAAMEQPGVRVVTHPGNPAFPVEVPVLARAALQLGVALEINNASFSQARRGSREVCSVLARHVALEGGLVCLSSDAHIACQVGQVADAWQVASECGIAAEQVVNRTYEGLARFLRLDEP